jgi:hypothetical protein
MHLSQSIDANILGNHEIHKRLVLSSYLSQNISELLRCF